jgi:hypothetical protein
MTAKQALGHKRFTHCGAFLDVNLRCAFQEPIKGDNIEWRLLVKFFHNPTFGKV